MYKPGKITMSTQFRNVSLLSCVHCCPHRTGISALVALASMPTSRWHLWRHSAGVVDLVALVSMPLFCWRCRRLCVVAVVPLALPPASCWCLCQSFCWYPCRLCADAVVVLVLLPSLHLRCLQHHAGIFTSIPLVLLPLSCFCRRCAGVIALVAPTLPPVSRWYLCRPLESNNLDILLSSSTTSS